MTQATTIASLLVQLGMDSAQFERAAGKAVSKTQQIAQTFNVTSKDVYSASQRMGVSVTQFGNTMTALQARVNPAVTALANYKQEMNTLRNALRLGILTQEQFRGEVQKAMSAYRQSGTEVVKSTGSMQAGMAQLNYQIGDMATMWAMGAKPQQIFVSQASQVVQAISLMQGGAGKFATFMAGPWGMALQASVIVLSSLIPALMKNEDAMSKVEFATSAMSDAQSILGGVMDLTTGKINTQSKALLGLARAQAIAGQIEARRRVASARSELRGLTNQYAGSATEALTGRGVSAGSDVEALAGGRIAQSMLTPTSRVARSVLAGWNTEDAIKSLDRLQKAGKITEKQFLELGKTVSDLGVENENVKIYEDLQKALDGDKGALAQFLNPKDPKKPRKGKDPDKIDARYDEEMNRLLSERAQLEAEHTQTIEAKYRAEITAIDNDLASFKANTLANKDIGSERQQALILEATKNADLRKEIAENDRDDALADKASAILEKDLELQMQQVQLNGQLALSTREQRDADLKLLDLQDRLRIAQLDRIMATEAAGSAAWDNARVEKESIQTTRGQREALVNRQHMSPLERYSYDLKASAANLNEAMESIQVDAMESLNDQLAQALINFDNLGNVAKNVFKQMLADIIRLQLQQNLSKGLSGILGSIGGLFGGGTGFAASAASGVNWSAPIAIAGARAAGGPIRAGLPYLVGERGPEIVVPGTSGQVIPNHELGAMRGMAVQVVPSPYFDVVVQQQAAGVAAPMASAAAVQGSTGAQVALARKQSRSIP